MNKVVTKAGIRLYLRGILKRSNADVHTFMIVYTTMIRPVLEYASQVWHYNTPNHLSEEIETLRKHALKIILSTLNCSEDLDHRKILTLRERR